MVEQMYVDAGRVSDLRRRRRGLQFRQTRSSRRGVEHHLVHRGAEARKALGRSHLERGEEIRNISARFESGVVEFQHHLTLGVHFDALDELEADLGAEESSERGDELGASIILREEKLGEVYTPAWRSVRGRRRLKRL
jgi:hypothetical protein